MIQIIGPFFEQNSQNWTFLNMTHRIGPSLKNMTHRIWTLLIMTLRIELFSQNLRINLLFLPIWLTPRIQAFWTFSFDSKNWTLSWIWLKELNRVSKWLKELNRVSKWLKEFNLFFSKWLKEFNFFLKMTQRIEPFPQNDSKFLFFGFDSELIFFDYDS